MKVCTDIHGAQTTNPASFGDPLRFTLALPAGQIFTYVLTNLNIYMIGTNFGSDIDGLQTMDSNDFTDLLTFPLAPP